MHRCRAWGGKNLLNRFAWVRVGWSLAVFSSSVWFVGCHGLDPAATASSGTGSTANLNSINHIIVMAQENRSFDHYFGALPAYWAANNIPPQQFDGLPQFSGGTPPTNPGCDPAFPFTPGSAVVQDCVFDTSVQVAPFHLTTMCVENPSPDWNYADQTGPVSGTFAGNGYVWTAAHDARFNQPPFNDSNGLRAMGYYTGDDLPFYYDMATKFGTSDRWFSPVMSRTQVSRMYLIAATSHGHAYPLTASDTQLTDKTIFDLLDAKGVTWKNYVVAPNPTPMDGTSLTMFVYSNSHSQNIVDISQFKTDLANNTLPAVSFIDPGYSNGTDEHPDENDTAPGGSVQVGANYVRDLVTALMASSSWSSSAFIITWDEFGGFYDHVAPYKTVAPDGLPPSDLIPGDVCTTSSGETCNFDYTGFRVPMIFISPYAKKNFVSHSPADYTAALKLIETRFGLGNLTARDAAQIDMSEFFDFKAAAWVTPPTPATQPTTGPCYLDHLP
jgi:phospholipase C